MNISYNDTKKDLPCDQLETLFMSAGWCRPENSSKTKHMNAPFINSTLVVSAWDDERLVGAVRVLSDKIIRSVIYDLVILPEYKNKGIGTELVKRCIEHFPKSEWLVGTMKDTAGFYEAIGFKKGDPDGEGVFLSMPSIYQRPV